MNHQIEKLYRISQQPTRRIIGLMSGTSLDGLDIALCEVQNSGTSTQMKLEKFVTMDYTDDLKNLLLAGKSAFEVEQYALEHGMINLERDGIFKVIQGKTSLDEVYDSVKSKS